MKAGLVLMMIGVTIESFAYWYAPALQRAAPVVEVRQYQADWAQFVPGTTLGRGTVTYPERLLAEARGEIRYKLHSGNLYLWEDRPDGLTYAVRREVERVERAEDGSLLLLARKESTPLLFLLLIGFVFLAVGGCMFFIPLSGTPSLAGHEPL
jgi:hypothetical protein